MLSAPAINFKANSLRLALAFASLALLAGCSSSGGQTAAPGIPNSTTSVTPTPTVNYDTAEYRQSWSLDAVSAISAYNAGYTGKGVTVAVIDTGVDVNNSELKANISPDSTNVVTNNPADLQDTDGHGTAVAGVVAAVRNDVGTEGIAFDSTLLAVNATSACGNNCNFYQSDIANGIDYARLHGAKIINLSMGGTAVGVDLEGALRRAVTAGMLIVVAAGNYDSTTPTAGNPSNANPSDFAQVADQSWTNGQIIIAGSSNRLNQLSSFSDQAGDLSKNVYLVAPGEAVRTTRLGGGMNLASGTSFAAPLVAGAAAILLQEFPNLTAQQINNILLTTATDLGAPGVDNVYGYGLLDLATAIAPIGTASVPTGTGASVAVTGNGGPVSAAAVQISPAFGDALSISPALTNAMILDSYGRSYRMDLTTRIQRAASLPDLFALTEPGLDTIHRDLRPTRGTQFYFSADRHTAFAEIDRRYFANTDPARREISGFRWHFSQKFGKSLSLAAGSHVALASNVAPTGRGLFLSQPENRNPATGRPDDLSMAVTSRLAAHTALTMIATHSRLHDHSFHLDGRQNSVAAQVRQNIGAKLRLSLDVGVVNERGAVLGALSSGALALGDGAVTNYLALGINWQPARHLQIFGGWMSGRTRVDRAVNSLFRNVSSLHTRSFRAGLAASGVWNKGDRFGLMISQPLRVTSGQAQLMFAANRDYTNNSLSFKALNTSLAPSGRELDLEASYQLPLSNRLWMQTMFLQEFNAGHVAGGQNQTLAIIRLTTGF